MWVGACLTQDLSIAKATVLFFEIKLSNMLVSNSNCNLATALSDQWNVRAIHITHN